MSEWNQYGPDYDHPEYDGKPNTYLFATTPRSGSHYLGHLLTSTGLLGSPLEYFHPKQIENWKTRFDSEDMEEVMLRLFRRRTSSTGWFGIKAHWAQFEPISRQSRLMSLLDFRKYIRIYRKDRVAQAVSLAMAYQTNAWLSFHKPACGPKYDFDAIRREIENIESEISKWDDFFEAEEIHPIEVNYEELAADPERVVNSILACFGLENHSRRSDFPFIPDRQSTDLNREWKERFLREV
ncbi:MAG: Stf0 family sulfotransferase [Rhodocyclaceae bacterium]|nr:Stf0 family sulfotransferase [Rhodocyclaceae bacterium]